MNTIQNISSSLKVNDHNLTTDELWINYDLNGKEFNLIIDDAENVAELLKSAGYIENYRIREGLLVVLVELENVGLRHMPWREYIYSFTMDETMARILAVAHETDKAVRGCYIHQLTEIPDMINSFV